MNYLGLGHAVLEGERQVELMQGIEVKPINWDICAQKAELRVRDEETFPRDSLMKIGGVGSFISAACALLLGKREKTMSMAGKTVRVDEIVGLLEKYVGQPSEVTRVGTEELRKRMDSVQGRGTTRTESSRRLSRRLNSVR